MDIGLLTTGFGIVTLVIIAVGLFALRRRPIVWMLKRADARRARHVAAIAGLAEAMAHAKDKGDSTMYERLARHHASHRAALLSIDPKFAAAEVAAAPAFNTDRRAA